MAKRLPPDSTPTPDQPRWSTRPGSPCREPPRHGASGRAQLPSPGELEASLAASGPAARRATGSALLRAILPLPEQSTAAAAGTASALLRAILLLPERLTAALAAAALRSPRAVTLALLLGLGVGLFAEQVIFPIAVVASLAPAEPSTAPPGTGAAEPSTARLDRTSRATAEPLLEAEPEPAPTAGLAAAAGALHRRLLSEGRARSRVEAKLARSTAALERWRARHGRYPAVSELGALDRGAKLGAPGSLGQDSWGGPIAYLEGKDGYLLRSFGPDGEPSADDLVVLVEGGRATYQGLR